jgi:aspartate/methionine/tyrosine aminotransferase
MLIYLDGFDWLLNVKAGVFPIEVCTETFENALTVDLLPKLEEAFESSSRPIKGVLFTNPHNPFGRCYPNEVIMEVIKFCTRKDIHFISDELYAISRFDNPDLIHPAPFVSALGLDLVGAGCDPSRVHTIWSISKDLGSSGLRMVCLHNSFTNISASCFCDD